MMEISLSVPSERERGHVGTLGATFDNAHDKPME